MVDVASEGGLHHATIERVVTRAGVSRRTFYELFADRDACMLAAIERAIGLAAERTGPAWSGGDRWIDRVRVALWALLEFFEEQPKLAKLCFVYALEAGPAALRRLGEISGRLARVLDEGRSDAPCQPPPLTAEGVVGGALAVLQARVSGHPTQPLTELQRPLMSFIVMPYLGAAAARAELSRSLPPRSMPPRHDPLIDALADVPIRLSHRAMRVLRAIGEEPGLNNSQVSGESGITDEGQASKLLARLAKAGLIENTGEADVRNAAKAWRLTPAGERLASSIGADQLM